MNETLDKTYLLINPNTSEGTTALLTRTLAPLLPKNVRLHAVTAAFGAPYISTEASHAIAGHAVLDALERFRAERSVALSGVLIGCFGDPGLFALRETAGCPVTGLAEASFIEAAAHGEFAIVTGGARWKPMLRRLAENLKFSEPLVHIETVAPSGAELAADPEMAIACLTSACEAAVKSGAKAVILGGAGLAGFSLALQARCAVPLINSAEAGMRVLLAERGLSVPKNE